MDLRRDYNHKLCCWVFLFPPLNRYYYYSSSIHAYVNYTQQWSLMINADVSVFTFAVCLCLCEASADHLILIRVWCSNTRGIKLHIYCGSGILSLSFFTQTLFSSNHFIRAFRTLLFFPSLYSQHSSSSQSVCAQKMKLFRENIQNILKWANISFQLERPARQPDRERQSMKIEKV